MGCRSALTVVVASSEAGILPSHFTPTSLMQPNSRACVRHMPSASCEVVVDCSIIACSLSDVFHYSQGMWALVSTPQPEG